MALQKQPIAISFSQGLDTKTDPNQVAAGKMLVLQNSVFDKLGLLQKRNGFGLLSTLPTGNNATSLNTFQDSLLATGSSLYAYNADSTGWITKGTVQPISVQAQSLVRSSAAQTSPDVAVAANGLMCVTYMESGLGYYKIADSTTGQSIVNKVALPNNSVNPRVFLLGSYFVVTFGATVTATPHLQYVAIPTSNPTAPLAAADISTQVLSASGAYDAFVANNRLYVAWNASDVGNAVRITYMGTNLTVSASQVLGVYNAAQIAVTADTSGSSSVVYICFATSSALLVAAVDQNLNSVLAPTSVVTSSAINALTCIATAGSVTALYQLTATYPSTVRSDSLNAVTVAQSGTITSAGATILKSVGLGSKPFSVNGTTYVLAAHQSSYQPSYFLVNLSGTVLARLAYSNGGGYSASNILSNACVTTNGVVLAYLYKDNIQSISKANAGTDKQIFSTTGVNIATLGINNTAQYSSEIGSSLHLTGGQLWQYDGTSPVEHSFHVWPEDVAVSTSGTGGSLAAQQYYYCFTYEWTDSQGMLHRSAPSVPVGITTTGTTSSNTLVVPTLRLTAKSSVRIVGYRWSAGQQSYYQFTSISSPTLNDATVNTVSIVDTQADSAILGNTLLYTTGGVIENIAAPASQHSCLYKSRLVLIDAEDENLLWVSKQVIEGTPVEMSDLLTVYVAPTTGVQGSTGGNKAIAAMDDKLIMFKANAIYYMTGTGPDNTGAQNDFSEPTFVTSAVGSINPSSVVLTPAGIMFQSNGKGIWLLDRSLATKYVGDAVEAFNSDKVVGAISVPGTNQVRFTLDSGTVLVYDYYVGQWGTFTGIPGISATVYNQLHTYLNSYGQVLQETPGTYLDNGKPVLIKFTTSWLKLAGLQGFQRAYYFYLLGKYITPHTLTCSVAYDYNSSITQTTQISPVNYSAAYGGESLYGGGQYGGESSVEQWQLSLAKQKCQAIQLTLEENYDSSLGVQAGQGFCLSGLQLTVGIKGTDPKLPAKLSV